jgi:hypothetical protein
MCARWTGRVPRCPEAFLVAAFGLCGEARHVGQSPRYDSRVQQPLRPEQSPHAFRLRHTPRQLLRRASLRLTPPSMKDEEAGRKRLEGSKAS